MDLREACQEVWDRLPVRLQPNKDNTDPSVTRMIRDGWTVDEILTEVMKGNPSNPGSIVINLRKYAGEPPPSTWQVRTRPKAKPIGHQPCTDATHDPACEICTCEGTVVHHVPVPMPDWFKQQWKTQLAVWGVIPDA
jgi:hypothetical protein